MAVPLAPGHAALARQPDPIPPPAPEISDQVAMARVPTDLLVEPGLQLVLDRRNRQLMVLENGELVRRFPAAVGTVGWETPAGRHQVLEKVANRDLTARVMGQYQGDHAKIKESLNKAAQNLEESLTQVGSSSDRKSTRLNSSHT